MLRILVADDEYLIRKGLKKIISDYVPDSEILEAENGNEAVYILRDQKPDIAFLDIIMPETDGLSILKSLSKNERNTKIVIVSGHGHFNYAQEALNCGAKGYLLKPLNALKVHSILKDILDDIISEKKLLNAMMEREQLLRENNAMRTEKQLSLFLHSSRSITAPEFSNNISNEIKRYILVLFRICKENGAPGSTPDAKDVRIHIRSLLAEQFAAHESAFTDCPLCSLEFYMVIPKTDEHDLNRIKALTERTLDGISYRITASICETETSAVHDYHNYLHLLQDIRLCSPETLIFTENDWIITKPPPDELLLLFQMYLNKAEPGGIKTVLEKIFTNSSQINIRSSFTQILHILTEYCRDNNGCKKLQADLSSMVLDYFDSSEEIIEYLYKMICILIKTLPSPASKNCSDIVEYIKMYVDTHYHESISVKEISGAFAINPNYFSTLFKKNTGKSFIEYVNGVKIEKCCSMLGGTDASISEIAVSIGFTDIQYFYKIFKKTVGLTPMEYRQAAKEKIHTTI